MSQTEAAHNNRLIIVGTDSSARMLASAFASIKPERVIGFVETDLSSENDAISNGGYNHFPVIGRAQNLIDLVKKYAASGIVVNGTGGLESNLLTQIVKCYEEHIPVYEMADLYSQLTKKVPVQHVNHSWLVPHLKAPKRGFYNAFYNVTNYFLSVLGVLFVLTPLFPLIAAAIKLDSKGPVLFKQLRIGKRSRSFNLLKFRTMVKDAHTNGAAWTTKEDSRITSVGRWLRKFRLDELPQLINVLKGEMALIGPRPEAVELVKTFKKEIPLYEYRYLVLPGITGWAQVNHENTCSVEGALEKLKYDLYWIKNRSFWLDLKIIFKSVKVILTGYGAV